MRVERCNRCRLILACLAFVLAACTEHTTESSDWADPPDPVVITVADVASGAKPVVWVVHEPGHGGWQFYDSFEVGDRRPVVLPKTDLLALDQSLEAIIDLPVGWQAVREAPGAPWTRSPYP